MDHIDSVLAQWRAERPDLDTAPMGTIGRLKRLSKTVNDRMEQLFVVHGLNRASFDVLATLRRAGPPYALSPSALIEWTMVTSGTMTNRIDRLEAAGLVKRTRNETDGRGFVVGLTDAGFALIDRAVTEHVANQHRLTETLDDAEREQLDRLLAKWQQGLEG
ncbi:MarR family winged helix-turn-helix transcriptional regulator [Halomonas sp. V046]|uniref:MarR family winged helix-turn-helix transcriptional regulator n=1 Tax=Halomonas sp. V046 TaxID=3459611 RepID=UPI004044D778